MNAKAYSLPSELERQARKIAKRDGVSVENFIATAVSAMIGADRAVHVAKRMNKEDARKCFVEILDKVPDNPPMPGDEISSEIASKLKKWKARRASSK